MTQTAFVEVKRKMHLSGFSYVLTKGTKAKQVLDCPLELGSLSHLGSLSSEDLAPEGILVPDGCKVHIDIHEGSISPDHPLWKPMSPGLLQSLTWLNIRSYCANIDKADLPHVLSDDSPWRIKSFWCGAPATRAEHCLQSRSRS